MIAPGIYRKGEKHDENFYFNEISVRCPQIFRTLTNVEKLTYMQHYGCPTRLLDITTNPLVALYFACVGEDDSNGITANIDSLKAELKTKRAALKSAEKEVSKLEAKKAKEDQKAAEEAKKAEAEAVLKKLLADGMSAEEILAKLK